MTDPSDRTAPGAQPGGPDGTWAPPQGDAGAPPQGGTWAPPQDGATPAPQAPQKSGNKKWLAVGGGVLAAGVVGLGSLTGWFGAGDPEVGDCVQMASINEFEAVDCSSDEAEYKVVGIDEQEMTESEFRDAPVEDLCVDFTTTEAVLWMGDMVTEPGTIYCAAAV